MLLPVYMALDFECYKENCPVWIPKNRIIFDHKSERELGACSLTAMEEEEAELRNPFPSPPSHYKNYTNHNIQLLSLLRERIGDADLSAVNQYEVLADQQDVPEWPLAQLEKPRVDWIMEEGHYSVFGETWYVSEPKSRCLNSKQRRVY